MAEETTRCRGSVRRRLLIALLLLAFLVAARKQLLDLLFGKEDEFVYSASGQD